MPTKLPDWFVLPDSIWILVDTSNSNPGSKNYLWWFETRKKAIEFRKWHETVYPGKHKATLCGPYALHRPLPVYRKGGVRIKAKPKKLKKPCPSQATRAAARFL